MYTYRREAIMQIEHARGIIGAWFEGGNHHQLIVHYDTNHFSHITLLDMIKRLGFHGESR